MWEVSIADEGSRWFEQVGVGISYGGVEVCKNEVHEVFLREQKTTGMVKVS